MSLAAGLWIGMPWCPAAQGGVPEQAGTPVKVEFDSMAMKGDLTMTRKGMHESPPKLRFNLTLMAGEEWRFAGYSGSMKQRLELTDSSGTKLAPVEFDLGWLHQRIQEGAVSTSITGTAGEFPAFGASWVRLHGTLKVPLARQRQSPAYELPLQKGASLYFPLPGDDRDGSDGDIAVAPEPPTATLSLKECDREEKDGKSMRRATIVLETDSSFELESFQMVDEKGNVLKSKCREGSSSMGEKKRWWEKSMVWEETGNVSKLRLRLLYRVPAGCSAVPVDFKVGMGGVIAP